MKHFFLTYLLLLSSAATHAQVDTLIHSGNTWKYFTASDPGATWKNTGFNDVSWSTGPSQLGYGEGDEATVIPSGPSNNRYPTHYFRKTFNLPNPSLYWSYKFRLKRDDGIVIYVNGAEVWRNNMPTGAPTYNTWASSSCADDGQSWIIVNLPGNTFSIGNNLIAAEVHNNSATSSDISFELQLAAVRVGTIQLVHGPYLQMATDTSMTIRWRTDSASNSVVRYGLTAANLSSSVTLSPVVTEHIVRLSGLTPSTRYYYSIERTGQVVQRDSVNYFFTAAPAGSALPTKIWVTGDCGTLQSTQTEVMNEFLNHVGNQYINAWLLLGDNAYNAGTDSEYTSNFFRPYQDERIMKQTPIWPAPGNHDYANNSTLLANRSLPYYNNFTVPTNGEIGGVPSGTESFYSYNINNIHFISLDSYGTENGDKLYDTTGIQATWLKNDLAANTQPWTILYWHHPPFTKGSHNCDTESDLVAMRTKLIRILDRYKVDLVLCGHSHSYERSMLMKGYYTYDSLFSAAAHLLDSSSAKYDGTNNSCPYEKHTNSSVNEGIVYTVTGSAGKFGGQAAGYPHNAMYYSNTSNGGSTYISVNGNRLDAKFISDAGVIQDQYTIFKDVSRRTTLTINEGRSALLTASWPGNYLWSPLVSAQPSVNVSPVHSGNFIVRDSLLCLSDTFSVNVIDTIIPAISNCPAPIVAGSQPGICAATVSWNLPLATDTHLASMVGNRIPGSFFTLGQTTVIYTATDSSGNTNTCQFTVTVNDLQSPTIVCPATITANVSVNSCSAPVTYAQPAGTDNCPGASTIQTGGLTSGLPFPLGTTINSFRVTDASSRTSTCAFSVIVFDNQLPSIICPANITSSAEPGLCSATVNYIPPVGTDNCANPITVQLNGLASGAAFPTGATTNIFSVTDGSNNSSTCSFSITVMDNEVPVIACPANMTVFNSTGFCSATVNFTPPVGTDNCLGPVTTQTSGFASGASVGIGSTTNIFQVSDGAAHSSSCSFVVQVADTQAPAISCPGPVTANTSPGLCSAPVTFLPASGTDNCSGIPTISLLSGLGSGSVFPSGNSLVTFSAEDISGNSSTCSFLVSVIDSELPTLTCPASITASNDSGFCTAIVNYSSPAFSDNCSVNSPVMSSGLVSGSPFPLGQTIVIFSVIDSSGNSASCSFSVDVNDTEAPGIACPASVSADADSGNCSKQISFSQPLGFDNCGPVSIIQISGLPDSSVFPVGVTVNIFIANDSSGNSSSCSFSVSVNDTTQPGWLTCDTSTIEYCEWDTVFFQVPTAFDDCSAATVLQNGGPGSGSVFAAGTHVINFEAFDSTGNAGNCQFQVLIHSLPLISFVLQSDSLCLNDSAINLFATPVGGTFTGSGITGNLFDPGAAGTGDHVIWYTFFDPFSCGDSASVSLNVRDCSISSLSTAAHSGIRLYPNPANDAVYLEFPHQGSEARISIYSMSGSFIPLPKNVTGRIVRFDLAGLSQGMYFIKIENDKGENVFKLIKE